MFDPGFVLDFWFGELDADGLPPRPLRQRWFNGSRAFDREIRRRFISLLLIAAENGLREWREDPRGALAEILLLDQFSRHIHRGTRLAFEQDPQARRCARTVIERGMELALPPIQRVFCYMPLQHSEQLADQDQCVELLSQLAALGHSDRLRSVLEGFLSSAREHREIIRRFGRFPHRNRLLGRPSTAEERAFLEQGGRYYGQS